MTFVYPAVFTPHEKDNGFHVEFPDLECCEADGPDLEDAVEMPETQPETGSLQNWKIPVRSRLLPM